MNTIKSSDSFDQLLNAALLASGKEASPIGADLKAIEAFVLYCETHRPLVSIEGCQKLQARLKKIDKKSSDLQNLVERLNDVANKTKGDPTNFSQLSQSEQVKAFQSFSTIPQLMRWLELNSKTKRIALDISNWKEAKAWKTVTLSTHLRAHDFQNLFDILKALSEEREYHPLAQELARAYFEQATDDNLRMFLTGLSSQDRAAFFQLTGAEPFKRRSISLLFCDWVFGKNDFHGLLSRLPHLQSLDLSGCQACRDEHLISVNQCRSLKVLKLSYLPGLTGSGLSHLAPLKEMLTEIRLAKCDKLDRRQLTHLGMFQKLAILDLTQLHLQDHDLDFIPQIKSLTAITLSKNPALTDEAFKRLALLEKLETLILKDNPQITGHRLSHLLNLHHLDFEGCRQLQDNSLAGISKTLESLNLNLCTSLTGGALNHFRNLEHLRTLQCRQWSRFTEDEVKILGSLKLRLLDLSANPGLTSSHIAPLAGIRGLATLKLEGCSQLDNHALETLQSLKESLLELNLSGCIKITDVSRFKELSHLVRLFLDGTGIHGSLQPLSLLKQLRELDLSGCGIDTAALAPLVSLPHLASLALKSCKALTPDCLDLFRQMPAIQTVEMFGCEEAIPYDKVAEAGLSSVVQVMKPSGR